MKLHFFFPHIFLLMLFSTRSLLANTLMNDNYRPNYYNIREYGAIGDGISIDSDAINLAIEAATRNGGGTVFIPAGRYLCYSIRLKDNITLHLDSGSTLVAANPTEERGYDSGEDTEHSGTGYQDFGHSFWKNSLIWGIGLQNITIEGFGRIDGIGLVKWGASEAGTGNKAIGLKLCRNVTIRDISIFRGGHFAILPTGVDNFTIDNVKIDSNRDGINIDCCRNVRISNCAVNTPNDDAIVLKSSMALGEIRDTENVTITNCHVMGFDMGTFLDGTYGRKQIAAPDFGGVTGRIKLGTESTGGFKNITISNCIFEHSRGLALETVDGGDLENVNVSNLTMRDIVNAPIFLRRARRMRGPEGRPVGQFRRVNISNIVVENSDVKYACLIMGVPGYPVEDVNLSNIRIHCEGGAKPEKAEVVVPELEDGYPDPRNFGQIPAYGFFIRHASDIRMHQVKLSYEHTDYRPAFVMEDVNGLTLEGIELEREESVPSSFVSSNVRSVSLLRCTEKVGDEILSIGE
jgi:polygalacturonase